MKRLTPLIFSAFLVVSGCGQSVGDLRLDGITLSNAVEKVEGFVETINREDSVKANEVVAAITSFRLYRPYIYKALAGSSYQLQSEDDVYSRIDKVVNGRTADDLIEMGRLVFGEAKALDQRKIAIFDNRIKLREKMNSNLKVEFSDVATDFEYKKGSSGHGVMKLDYSARNGSSLDIRAFIAVLEISKKRTGEVVYRFNVPVRIDDGENFGPGATISESYNISTQNSFLKLNFLENYNPDELSAVMIPTFVSERSDYRNELGLYTPMSEQEEDYISSYNRIADVYGGNKIGAF